MPYPSLAVAVVMECKRLENRWQTEKWEPIGVLPDSESEGAAIAAVDAIHVKRLACREGRVVARQK